MWSKYIQPGFLEIKKNVISTYLFIWELYRETSTRSIIIIIFRDSTLFYYIYEMYIYTLLKAYFYITVKKYSAHIILVITIFACNSRIFTHNTLFCISFSFQFILLSRYIDSSLSSTREEKCKKNRKNK